MLKLAGEGYKARAYAHGAEVVLGLNDQLGALVEANELIEVPGIGRSLAKQTEALWAYFTLGPGLPLPAGLEVPTTGLPLVVKDRPEVMRTFMPDGAGTRPIAVAEML